MATFKELTGIDPIDEPAPQRPLNTIHQSGADTRRAASDEQEQLREDNTAVDVVKSAWERNITNNFVDEVQRKFDHEPDDTFDPTAWVKENKERLVGDHLEAYASVRSVGEAEELNQDQIRAMENEKVIAAQGAGGVAASILAGMVDPAELAVGVFTGGTAKGASVAKTLAKGAIQGAKGGLMSSAAGLSVDPLADSNQIIFGTLTGALIGAPSAAAFNRGSRAVKQNYAAEAADLPPADRDYVDSAVYMDTTMADNPQSLGAGAMTDQMDEMGPISKSIYDQSTRFIRDNDLAGRFEDTDLNVDTPTARTAKRFSDALANQTYIPDALLDFDRLMQGGNVEKTLAYNLLESPEGRLRNNRSAAMLNENYQNRLMSRSLPQLEEGYAAWAKGRNLGVIDRNRPTSRQAFDREVIEELEARFHEGKPVSKDPIIAKAADAVDDNYAEAVRIGKGRDGETSISGFEDMQAKSGFFNHKWSGKAIRSALAKGHSDAEITALLTKGITQTNPDLDPAKALMIGKAIYRRAKAKDDGIDTNMLSTLDSDAQEYLRSVLTDSGYDEKTIENLIDSIRGRKEEQGQMGTTKKRTQVDLRTTENGLSLLDLVDTNLTRTLSQYNRELSGNAALARKGIPNKTTRKDMIEAALAERRAKGMTATDKERQFLEDMFTYFDSGPIGGGVTEGVARVKRVTNLALLNQLGLTQLGETGAQIASVGMDTWQRHAKALYAEMRGQGPEGPIITELRPFMGEIGKDHLLFRDDLMLDELSTSRELNSFLGKLDFGLGKGQRLQGYASGFFHVKGMQQKVAVASQADKVMQRLRDGVDQNLLDDIGIPQSIGKYVKDGTVEFDADGFVNRLNMDRWSEADAEDFALALHRHTNQVVQKAMAGEETVWMHKTVGSMMLHLKSFPLLAMRKQSARAANVSTPLAVASLTMGLATAGLAYEAKQIINGRTERVNGKDALKGAMNMSNMTGWVPMLTDPAAAMLGYDINSYGRHDINSGVIGAPPALTVANRLMQMPAMINPTSTLSGNERIRIAQTTPLVGNLYGFSLIFNSMKQ